MVGASVVQLVARWITDHYHLSSNLGLGVSEWYFVFDFASLLLEVARPSNPTVCTKVATKHQSMQGHLIFPMLITKCVFISLHYLWPSDYFHYLKLSFWCPCLHIIHNRTNCQLHRWCFFVKTSRGDISSVISDFARGKSAYLWIYHLKDWLGVRYLLVFRIDNGSFIIKQIVTIVLYGENSGTTSRVNLRSLDVFTGNWYRQVHLLIGKITWCNLWILWLHAMTHLVLHCGVLSRSWCWLPMLLVWERERCFIH